MLSDRIKSLRPSPTLALSAKAKAMAAEGKDVISLTVGEPDWDTFPAAKVGGVQAIEMGKTKYAPTEGYPELRQAIINQTLIETGVKYELSEATVSTGGKFIIFSALQSVCNPGDEILIPAPYWVSYPDMVQLCEGKSKIIVCEKKSGFKLTAKHLEESISRKTKVLIINSPSNPTGETYSEDELRELAQVLLKNPHVFVLTDDIYNRLYFEANVAPHILQVEPRLRDRVLVVSGVSKSYSMTGWRVGWALGPKWWIAGMNVYQSQTVSCAASISQVAALEGIKNADQEIQHAVVKLKKRRDFFAEKLRSIEGLDFSIPSGAFYFWLDIRKFIGKKWQGKEISGSQDFVKILLEDFLVATVDGLSFGLEGYIRVSYALNEKKLEEAVVRMVRFCAGIDVARK
ncbi:MAG: pyridoxal phosphate-dependent aminotransferase [Pseudomonadota bacterium]|nr:pyridoxal phosphate-dependent aminotransferase [Pseudomonadota bacterium]